MKLYTYVIGYGTYEESRYDYLTHTKQFSKDQFREMVHACALKAIEIGKEENEYGEAEYIHSYGNIHSPVVDLLKSDYGFRDVEVEQRWTAFGWASVFVPHDWKGYRREPDDLTYLVEAVRAAGYSEKDDWFLRDREDTK